MPDIVNTKNLDLIVDFLILVLIPSLKIALTTVTGEDMNRFVWICLFLALITGFISFGGFLTGAALLIFGKALFFIFALLFMVLGIKTFFFGTPPAPR